MPNPRAGALPCLFILACTVSRPVGATDLPGADAFTQAVDALAAGQGTPGVTPPLPLSDPRVQRVLSLATDQGVFGNAPLTAADMKPVMDLCGKAAQVSVPYSMAGIASLKPLVPQGPSVYQPRVLELTIRNGHTYQDLLLPMLAFSAYCAGHELPLLGEYMQRLPASERTPVRLGGLRQMRMGATAMVTSAILMAADKTLSPTNRKLALVAMADNAPPMAAAMTVAERAPIAEAANQAAAGSEPAFRSLLETIAKAYDDKKCTALCAYGE